MATLYNPNITSPFFVNNAEDISISGAHSGERVLVTVDGHQMELSGRTGSTHIPFREIAKAIAPSALMIDSVSNAFVSNAGRVYVNIILGDNDSIYGDHYEILHGGIDNGQNPQHFIKYNFLTWAPQVQRISPDSLIFLRNYLPELPDDNTLMSAELSTRIEAYFSLSGRTEKTVISVSKEHYSEYRDRLVCTRYSEDIVRNIVGNNDPDDKLLAFDVWFEYNFRDLAGERMLEHNSKSHRMRFIIGEKRQNHREFFFRNSLGVLDQVHSHGDLGRAPKFEFASFTNADNESQLETKTKDIYTVNTGRWANAQEREMWMEFFKSDCHYILDNGRIKEIIIDDVKAETTLTETDSATFNFHYAKKPEGRYIERQTLNDYSYGSETL